MEKFAEKLLEDEVKLYKKRKILFNDIIINKHILILYNLHVLLVVMDPRVAG